MENRLRIFSLVRGGLVWQGGYFRMPAMRGLNQIRQSMPSRESDNAGRRQQAQRLVRCLREGSFKRMYVVGHNT
jgi:hypothetical protein